VRGLAAIYGRELRGYFTSPIAYVATVVFLVIAALFFTDLLRDYLSASADWREGQLARGLEVTTLDVHLFLRRFIGTLGVVTLFVLPFLTMSSFAEEYRAGTMELLLTSPVSQRSVVLGKFLAASTFFAMMLTLSFLMTSMLLLYGDPHAPSILVGYLGVWLQGESFLVVGMFISSLTRSQVVAGVGGLGGALLLWLLGSVGDPSSTLGVWLRELSLLTHFEDFTKGVLDTKHVVYYVCFVVFGLFLTLRSLESLKYR
jgi:ABC-2 type transport system permease protein